MSDMVGAAASMDVAKMGLNQKISESIRTSLPVLPLKAKAVTLAMISPEALAAIAATTTLWLGSHFLGVGVIADLILLLGGYVMVGKTAWDASGALLHFALTVTKAKTDNDLNVAADYFVQAVLLAGATAVSALLLGRGRGKMKPASPVAAAAEEGTLYSRTVARLNLQVIRQLVIDGWKQPGKWPVKVFKIQAGQKIGDAVQVGGYITTENAVAGAGCANWSADWG